MKKLYVLIVEALSCASKPHILDAMKKLNEVWTTKKWCTTESILHCWRKSAALPVIYDFMLAVVSPSGECSERSARKLAKKVPEDIRTGEEEICRLIQGHPEVPKILRAT